MIQHSETTLHHATHCIQTFRHQHIYRWANIKYYTKCSSPCSGHHIAGSTHPGDSCFAHQQQLCHLGPPLTTNMCFAGYDKPTSQIELRKTLDSCEQGLWQSSHLPASELLKRNLSFLISIKSPPCEKYWSVQFLEPTDLAPSQITPAATSSCGNCMDHIPETPESGLLS